MGMQIVTLDLPDEMVEEAEKLAERAQKSVPELLRAYIGEAIQKDISYERAHRRFLEMLDEGMNFGSNGQITWTRDELHERKD